MIIPKWYEDPITLWALGFFLLGMFGLILGLYFSVVRSDLAEAYCSKQGYRVQHVYKTGNFCVKSTGELVQIPESVYR